MVRSDEDNEEKEYPMILRAVFFCVAIVFLYVVSYGFLAGLVYLQGGLIILTYDVPVNDQLLALVIIGVSSLLSYTSAKGYWWFVQGDWIGS